MGVVDELVQGREAFDQRAWGVAVERLSAVDRRRLNQDDLLRLGLAAYLSGDQDSCVRELQEAYRVALAAGETLEAVRVAFWLGLVLLTSGEHAVGGGWVARAYRLLQDEPEDVVERGYLLIHEMHRHIGQGDFQAALEIAPQIAHYGREFGDANLVAMGLSGQGRLLMYAGQV
ncbi:MAG TPA: helix-turn-helix transcriptional regulator, partial [Propionibacteriaceae bacterium]|nr:helix-turn-helix transcriptional regulator [Propionibacteriaceae bacterium]